MDVVGRQEAGVTPPGRGGMYGKFTWHSECAAYSSSKPPSPNLRVWLFSVTVRTMCSWRAIGDIGFNLQG